MSDVLKRHQFYFLLLAAYFLVGVLLLVLMNKGDEILFFSQHRSSYWNIFFQIITRYGEAFPYVIAAIGFLLTKQFRKVWAVLLLPLIITVLSFLSKTLFKQPRPAKYFESLHRFEEINWVNGVDIYYGLNSFPSGHTMSAFAVSTLLVFYLPKKSGLEIVFFALAFFVSISRMYLAHHFLQDILMGAFLGTLVSVGVYLGFFSLQWKAKK
jgi:membrane-associated phospholipid phosphatase